MEWPDKPTDVSQLTQKHIKVAIFNYVLNTATHKPFVFRLHEAD